MKTAFSGAWVVRKSHSESSEWKSRLFAASRRFGLYHSTTKAIAQSSTLAGTAQWPLFLLRINHNPKARQVTARGAGACSRGYCRRPGHSLQKATVVSLPWQEEQYVPHSCHSNVQVCLHYSNTFGQLCPTPVYWLKKRYYQHKWSGMDSALVSTMCVPATVAGCIISHYKE